MTEVGRDWPGRGRICRHGGFPVELRRWRFNAAAAGPTRSGLSELGYWNADATSGYVVGAEQLQFVCEIVRVPLMHYDDIAAGGNGSGGQHCPRRCWPR